MSHRTLYIAQAGSREFPRFVIYDNQGHAWDGSSWEGHPLLYADKNLVSNDCFDLQRREAASKPHRIVVEVPLRFEAFSDASLDIEQLRDWLIKNVGVSVDVVSGSGPTPESIVIGTIDWPRLALAGVPT